MLILPRHQAKSVQLQRQSSHKIPGRTHLAMPYTSWSPTCGLRRSSCNRFWGHVRCCRSGPSEGASPDQSGLCCEPRFRVGGWLGGWSARVLSALQLGPCRHLGLSEGVVQARATVQHVGPLDHSFAAAPRPPRACPLQASVVASLTAGLGWDWSLGKMARFTGLKAVPPGLKCRLRERTVCLADPHACARANSRPGGPSDRDSPFPLWPRSARTVSAWRVGAGPVSAAPSRTKAGGPRFQKLPLTAALRPFWVAQPLNRSWTKD